MNGMAVGHASGGRLGAARSGLAIAAAIVAFGFLGSRLLGVARTAAIADAFGASPELDAYWVAFRIPDPDLPAARGGDAGERLHPRVYAPLPAPGSWTRPGRSRATSSRIVMVATAALCLIALALTPWLVPLFAPGLGEDIGRGDELTAEAVKLTRIMLLSPLLALPSAA